MVWLFSHKLDEFQLMFQSLQPGGYIVIKYITHLLSPRVLSPSF
jgi:hypothetical protein